MALQLGMSFTSFTAGAGMFIGTVVLGAVVGASKGASVRGALIRDVSAYALAVAMVAWILGSGQVSAAGLTLCRQSV